MFTIKEQRKACLTLASMLENQVESYYIDITDVYSEIVIHCDKLMEVVEANKFLNHLQPFELEKVYNVHNYEEGKKFYCMRIRIKNYKNK